MLVASDLHLTDKSDDEYRWGIFPVLSKLAKKHRQDKIVILGDVTDHKDRHSSQLVNRVVRNIVKLTKVAQVYILAGNHDYVESTVPFFKFLQYIPKVSFYIEPSMMCDGVVALPHSRNFKSMVATSSQLLRQADVVFMHQTVSGVPVNGIELTGVDTSPWLSKEQLWVSGDIHVPQEYKGVVYCGAPYQVRFGDTYSPRVLLVDGKRWTSISTSQCFPRKLSFTVESAAELRSADIRKKDQVKVKLVVGPQMAASWRTERQKLVEYVRGCGAQLGAILVDARKLGADTAIVQGNESNRLRRLVSDPTTAVRHYCRVRKIEANAERLGLTIVGANAGNGSA